MPPRLLDRHAVVARSLERIAGVVKGTHDFGDVGSVDRLKATFSGPSIGATFGF